MVAYTATATQRAMREGYASGLEEAVGNALKRKGVPHEFEAHTIHFLQPARKARYTPDFVLPNGIIIETKGRFVTKDRQKHLNVKEQHPDLDIRFVFSNPQTRISKTSSTTYAMWCHKHGFQYAAKSIPDAWLKETPNPVAIEALKKAGMK